MKTYNVLFISLDKDLLDKNSRVFERHKNYSRYFNKLYVSVLSKEENIIRHENLETFSFGGSNKLVIFLKLLIKLNKFLKNNKIDVISTQDPFFTGIIVIILAKKYRIFLNIQVHAEFFSNKYFRKESIKNYLYYFAGKYIIKQANSIRCVSHYENDNLISKGLNSYFCPIGIEVKDFNTKRNYDFKNNILFIGRLTKQKNIHLLLIVFSRLVQEYNRLKLIIVGDGKIKDKLIYHCKMLNIYNNIEFLINKNKKEVIKLIANSDFVVLPSFYEGWGLVSVEAMATGTPVIMTRTGAGTYLIRNMQNGIVVDINNEDQLYKAMKLLLTNQELRERLGKAGQKTVLKKEWSQEYLTKKWINILEKTAEMRTY